jgi:hypothetical protein
MGKRNGSGKYLLLIVALLSCAAGATRVETSNDLAIVFTQSPISVRDSQDGKFGFRRIPPDGSRIVRLQPASRRGTIEVLTKGFSAACDPCVSFDGTMLLFAAKRSVDDDWNIWEMGIDGSQPRQITHSLGQCREPAYLARSSITPPEFTDKVRWIVFTSTAAGTHDETGEGMATSLYVKNLEPIEGRDTVIWRATFNLSHDFSPTALRDGRILFSSWQRLGGRFQPHGMIALMTTNWAGTGLNVFYGNHDGETVKSMACEMPDRTLVFVESDGRSGDGSGQLAAVSFKRPLHSRERLSDGTGRYTTPHPLPDGSLAVSFAQRDESYGIYDFDTKKKRVGRVLYDDPDWDDLDAIPIAQRDEPMGRITIVVDSKETGHLQCLNVYDSNTPEAATIKKGDVKRVRFVEGLPLSQDNVVAMNAGNPGSHGAGSGFPQEAAHTRMRILGEAPVEADGSFYVEVPGDTPFFIQTLDEDGMALQTMRSWMWVRRGSRRGCIGCHEDKELSPENRATQALIKAEPTRLLATPEERRTVDFRTDVAPIVEEKCVGCHSGNAAQGGLDLAGGETAHMRGAYEKLTQPVQNIPPEKSGSYVQPGSARNSPLIWLVLGVPNGIEITEPHSHPHVTLTDREKRLLVEWIDLGGEWDNTTGQIGH